MGADPSEFPPDGPAPMEIAMHYFKRNIGDYHKKAGKLTMLEHGAYTLLIDACYDRERFPTLDEAYDWTWANSEAERDAVLLVLRRFFTLRDGVYKQKRIAEELVKYQNKRATNAAIAKEREAKRRAQRGEIVNDTSTNQHETCTDRHLTTNHKPITIRTPFARDDSPSQKVTWTDAGFEIPEAIRSGFNTAYPAVDVEHELAKAHTWLLTNPKNRKSNYARFLNNWLQRCQDKAPRVAQPTDWKDDPRFKGLL